MPYSCYICGFTTWSFPTSGPVYCGQCQAPDAANARVDALYHQLKQHMKVHAGFLIVAGSFASEEFDRLYCAWICARWDAGDDPWVRKVWPARPAVSPTQ